MAAGRHQYASITETVRRDGNFTQVTVGDGTVADV